MKNGTEENDAKVLSETALNLFSLLNSHIKDSEEIMRRVERSAKRFEAVAKRLEDVADELRGMER